MENERQVRCQWCWKMGNRNEIREWGRCHKCEDRCKKFLKNHVSSNKLISKNKKE